jgi:hypothetical protein
MRNEMGAASVKSACTLQSSYSSVDSPSRVSPTFFAASCQRRAATCESGGKQNGAKYVYFFTNIYFF